MLERENFRERLGTWYEEIEPLFDNGVMNTIYQELKSQSRSGVTIAPDKENTFKCFRETPIEQCKVVMMGMCPYHTVIHGKMVADGLLMGCSNHNDKYIAPSLEQYYGAVEEEFKEGLCLPCQRTGDLTYLSYQGVLMFNAALTTKIGEAKAHQELWKPFTEHLMKVFNKRNLPVIFLGSEAWKYNTGGRHHYKLTHPAHASYSGTKWTSGGIFKKINEQLDDWYQKPIHWVLEEAPF